MKTSESEALLHRYLKASRREYEVVEAGVIQACKRAAVKAFPGLDLGCEYLAVRSKRRRCEYTAIKGSPVVVLDLELSDRMAELDLLAQIPHMKPDWVYAFFVVLLSDVFRRHRDFRRYRYCVLKARGDIGSLRGLSSLPKGDTPIQAGLLSVLLHEIAHVAFKQRESLIDGPQLMSRAALSKFADASAEQATSGRHPVPGGVTLGVPFEQYDQRRLETQLRQYAETLRGNAELEEELTCDVISTLAFVNLEAGINCFGDLTPRNVPLSVRQLGDIFYLGIKTSRYLQVLSGVDQFGANVVAGTDDLNRTLIEMTARTNALTHILLMLFQAQLEIGTFHEKPDFGRPLRNDELLAGMQRSIAHLMTQHHNRLLGPFEDLTGFFVDDEAFERDNEQVLKTFGAMVPANFADVDALRAELPF